jgi:glucosamine-6-phosphate deaminase
MKIILSSTPPEASNFVVERVLDHIQGKPSSVIGLATGKTMIPVYQQWIKLAKDRQIDHSRCFFFLLDEYQDLESEDSARFENFLKIHFFNPMNIRRDQYALPAMQGDFSYEQLIKESGGIDIQLLGIGRNGHVGFNEPGSKKDSKTRVVFLTPNTLEANRDSFTKSIPAKAISMGVGTILQSKSILLLAIGKTKSDAIKFLLNHHDDESCPATYLKDHPHFTLVLDSEAASKINLKI